MKAMKRADKMNSSGKNPVIHANALVYGASGILIRGKSGSGKTTLMLNLIENARNRNCFAAIVSDDQTAISCHNGRLLAHRPDPVHSIGSTLIDMVVELIDPKLMERLPDETNATILETKIRKLQVPANDEIAASRLILNAIANPRDT